VADLNADLKAALLRELSRIEGLEALPSPVAGGTMLAYRGKEFAHFHHDHELDLRLTKRVIQSLGLSHPPNSLQHPKRSTSSPWIEIRFSNSSDIDEVVKLVKRAIAE
jgi:hypothetical protein